MTKQKSPPLSAHDAAVARNKAKRAKKKERVKHRKIVGRRLKLLRKILELDPKCQKTTIAAALGVPFDNYDKWERGISMIPVEYGTILAAKFRVNLVWLYSKDPKRLEPEFLRKA
jgi:hypothetical protein